MRIIIEAIIETATQYNAEAGDWSGPTQHASGTLGVANGWTGTLADFNKRLEAIGLPPLIKNGQWEDGDDQGDFHLSFIGDSDGIPNNDGSWLYDIALAIHEITTKPLALPG